MRRDMAARFIFDGRDGWRPISDVPASTQLERSIVVQRIGEELAAVRVARTVRREEPGRPVRARLATALGRERYATRRSDTGAIRPAVDATSGTARATAMACPTTASRPTTSGRPA